MDFKNCNAREILMKRASGYECKEEHLEFERAAVKQLLFCEKFNRLYTDYGFIKAKKNPKGVIVCEVPIKFIKPKKNIIKGLKLLKKLKKA